MKIINNKQILKSIHIQALLNMKINRKQILKSFLENIAHISDQTYQERVWISTDRSKRDDFDFDEFVNWFFDIADPVLDDYKNFNITESQYQLLIKFREVFDGFSDEHDLPQEFISSPEWKKIMEMAKEILKAFNYQHDHI
jgi:hypothetical protein